MTSSLAISTSQKQWRFESSPVEIVGYISVGNTNSQGAFIFVRFRYLVPQKAPHLSRQRHCNYRDPRGWLWLASACINEGRLEKHAIIIEWKRKRWKFTVGNLHGVDIQETNWCRNPLTLWTVKCQFQLLSAINRHIIWRHQAINLTNVDIISEVQWKSPDGNFTRNTQPSLTKSNLNIAFLQFHSNFQGANEPVTYLHTSSLSKRDCRKWAARSREILWYSFTEKG